MRSITPRQLQTAMAEDADLVLIDVREPYEHEAFNIGGLLIPLGSIMERAAEIPTDKTVVLYCRKGVRSAIAIQRLEARYGHTHLVNLQGGMEAWAKAIGT